jgi:ribosome-associated protein
LTDILAERERAEKDDRDLRSRSDARREQKRTERALADLGTALVEATDKQLARLNLPEPLLEVVMLARRIKSPVARHRAIKLVRKELRQSDAAEIERRYRELREPTGGARSSTLEQWRQRLIEGGDQELDVLLAAFPDADRQRLRTLCRNLKKATTEEERKKVARLLTSALRQLLG